MDKLRELLNIKEDAVNAKMLFLLIVAAYIFSVAVRFVWTYYFAESPQSLWSGQIMINTNDGYYWAEGARDILRDKKFYQLSPVDAQISILTAFFAKILPFSFETVILYMPAFLGSLLVVPIVLIGRAINQTFLGFIAALIGGIAWSYYNRTMVGYYDTDMLTIVLPAFVLWSLILGITHNKNRYLLITTLSIIIYNIWYPGSYSLNFAMAGMLLLYTVAFDRKNLFNYKLLLFIAVAIASIPLAIKLVSSIVLFLFFHFLKEKSDKSVLPLFGIGIILVAFTGGLGPILAQLSSYVFRVETLSNKETTLQFFNVVQTVREAGNISFETFANRISGHPLTFVLSTIGYILMVIRYPAMLLGLPLLGLGFLAYTGGLRFTVYTVPVNALGIAFLILLASKYISAFFKENQRKASVFIIASLLSIAALYPNIKHVYEYMVPTVFSASEVRVLDGLKKIASREDYVLAWWDYGYPIRFYADVNTLVDGARHDGNVNYAVSYGLTYPQTESSNMARLATEYSHKEFTGQGSANHIKEMMEHYGQSDPNQFLDMLKSKKFKLPEKTRDIYYYLPLRMLGIYPTVRLFSNLDLTTGTQIAKPFLYEANSFSEKGDMIVLGNGMVVNKKNNSIQIGNQQIPLNSLYVTVYDNSGKLRVQQQNFNMAGPISIIYMKSYNKFLVLDQQTLNSTYIQLFVFENYDRELFEPVILDPLAKVYRLKK